MTDIERGPTIRVLIVGSGKLASELLESLKTANTCAVLPWGQRDESCEGKQIVVHAGSGRELDSIIEFCSRNSSVLIELSTNGGLDTSKICFPTILCPNINILMLKLMAMFQDHGNQFIEYDKSILESHQSTKTSKPGTATLPNSLGVGADRIISVRDPAAQEHENRNSFSSSFPACLPQDHHP